MICASPLTAVQTLAFAEVLVVTGAAVLVLGRHFTTRKPYDVLSPTYVIAFLSNYLH